MKNSNGITIGKITDVKKSGDEEGVYFANVELSLAEGFPLESSFYCARSDDYAVTGKWIYQQIISGNFVGKIKQLPAMVDPMTEQPVPVRPTN